VKRSQETGFLLVELVCALGLFMISVTAVSGLLAQLAAAERTASRRLVLLAKARSMVEAGRLDDALAAQEVVAVMRSKQASCTLVRVRLDQGGCALSFPLVQRGKEKT